MAAANPTAVIFLKVIFFFKKSFLFFCFCQCQIQLSTIEKYVGAQFVDLFSRNLRISSVSVHYFLNSVGIFHFDNVEAAM